MESPRTVDDLVETIQSADFIREHLHTDLLQSPLTERSMHWLSVNEQITQHWAYGQHKSGENALGAYEKLDAITTAAALLERHLRAQMNQTFSHKDSQESGEPISLPMIGDDPWDPWNRPETDQA